MARKSKKARLEELEVETLRLAVKINELEQTLGDRAPASEIERLNYAFDLIADRAPATEVERLNLAFEQIADRAPATEVGRLDHAFELISRMKEATAPSSEIERVNHLYGRLTTIESERVVEIPWVLRRYSGEARVLEVGYAFAEELYLRALEDLRIPFLVGIDMAATPYEESISGLQKVQGDVLASCFRAKSFDLVLCVSTIEHIGRDNSRYGLDSGRDVINPDQVAIQAMADWLVPGGRLLVTVPFGRYEDHGWLINYDIDALDALVQSSGLEAVEMVFYGWGPGGWRAVEPEDLSNHGYRSFGAAHASGVALLELRRRESDS
jgi:O-antigen chain-terminating methyltransferase